MLAEAACKMAARPPPTATSTPGGVLVVVGGRGLVESLRGSLAAPSPPLAYQLATCFKMPPTSRKYSVYYTVYYKNTVLYLYTIHDQTPAYCSTLAPERSQRPQKSCPQAIRFLSGSDIVSVLSRRLLPLQWWLAVDPPDDTGRQRGGALPWLLCFRLSMSSYRRHFRIAVSLKQGRQPASSRSIRCDCLQIIRMRATVERKRLYFM